MELIKRGASGKLGCTSIVERPHPITGRNRPQFLGRQRRGSRCLLDASRLRGHVSVERRQYSVRSTPTGDGAQLELTGRATLLAPQTYIRCIRMGLVQCANLRTF